MSRNNTGGSVNVNHAPRLASLRFSSLRPTYLTCLPHYVPSSKVADFTLLYVPVCALHDDFHFTFLPRNYPALCNLTSSLYMIDTLT